jgi:hypothetical protein
VLGMDWLERFSPMTCDWLAKWIEFSYQGEIIRLQGMLPSQPQMQLQEVSVERVQKWDRVMIYGPLSCYSLLTLTLIVLKLI